MKLEAAKDGEGNIIISENSFEMLLACLDNQKFIHEAPQNGDSISVGENEYKQTQESIQAIIDKYNRACRDVLHPTTSTYKSIKKYTIEKIEHLVKQAWVDGNYNTDINGNPSAKIYAVSDESYWKQIKEKENL